MIPVYLQCFTAPLITDSRETCSLILTTAPYRYLAFSAVIPQMCPVVRQTRHLEHQDSPPSLSLKILLYRFHGDIVAALAGAKPNN